MRLHCERKIDPGFGSFRCVRARSDGSVLEACLQFRGICEVDVAFECLCVLLWVPRGCECLHGWWCECGLNVGELDGDGVGPCAVGVETLCAIDLDVKT